MTAGTRPIGLTERNSASVVGRNPRPQSSRVKSRPSSPQVQRTLRTLNELARPRMRIILGAPWSGTLVLTQLRQPVLHLPARRLAPAQAEGEREGDRDRAEGQAEGEVDDVVGDAHRAQAHGDDQAEDGDAREARDAGALLAARAVDRLVGEVGEPEADREDRAAEQDLTTELDEHRHEVAHLRELE